MGVVQNTPITNNHGGINLVKFSKSILAPNEDAVKMHDQYLSDNHETNAINKTL